MAKEDLKRMSGTPWHVGYVRKEETDPRRDKRVCLYYTDGYCSYRLGKCIGSSHCKGYKRAAEELAKQRRRDRGGWQAEARIPMPDVIQRGDQVTVFCRQTQERYTFTIAEGDEELPPVHQLCIGQTRGGQFTFREYTYRIADFRKRGG